MKDISEEPAAITSSSMRIVKNNSIVRGDVKFKVALPGLIIIDGDSLHY
jgi:hypothetical protein